MQYNITDLSTPDKPAFLSIFSAEKLEIILKILAFKTTRLLKSLPQVVIEASVM